MKAFDYYVAYQEGVDLGYMCVSLTGKIDNHETMLELSKEAGRQLDAARAAKGKICAPSTPVIIFFNLMKVRNI